MIGWKDIWEDVNVRDEKYIQNWKEKLKFSDRMKYDDGYPALLKHFITHDSHNTHLIYTTSASTQASSSPRRPSCQSSGHSCQTANGTRASHTQHHRAAPDPGSC